MEIQWWGGKYIQTLPYAKRICLKFLHSQVMGIHHPSCLETMSPLVEFPLPNNSWLVSMHTSVMVNLAQCPNVRNLVSKSNRIGYSGLPRIPSPPPPQDWNFLQDLETLVQNKPPSPHSPKIGNSHGRLRKFDPEYPTPRLDLLMVDFVSWTGVWRIPLDPVRIPSRCIGDTRYSPVHNWKRENQDQFSQSCPWTGGVAHAIKEQYKRIHQKGVFIRFKDWVEQS